MNCTLNELSDLLTRGLPHVSDEYGIGTKLVYTLVYPDLRPGARRGGPSYNMKNLGTVFYGSDIPDEDGNPSGIVDDSELTLEQARFVIGDYVCVSIYPQPDMDDEAPAAVSPAESKPPRRPSGYDRGEREYGRLNDREYAEPPRRARENGYHPYERPHGRRGARYPDISRSHVPQGEWRRGDIPPGGGGYRGGGRGRGRTY